MEIIGAEGKEPRPPRGEGKGKRARRGKGSGSIYRPHYKTESGKVMLGGWRVRYTWKHKVHDEKAPGNTKAAAQELLKKRYAEIINGEFSVGSDAEHLRYEDLRAGLLRYYEVNGKKSLLTAKDGKTKYLSGLNHLDKFFAGRYYALDITASVAEEFKLHRVQEGAKNANVNRSLGLLRQMFHVGLENEKLKPIHVPKIKMLPEPPPRQGFLEPQDFPRLYEALPQYLRPVVVLGFFTGMRLGEIQNLRWKSIDLIEGEIHLSEEETKTGFRRTVPLPGKVLELLRIERSKRPNAEYAFSPDGSRPLGSFRKTWNRACIAAGLGQTEEQENGKRKYRGLVFHDLRRSAIRHLVRSGVSEHVATAISGHRTLSVFKRYDITSGRDLRDAAQLVEGYVQRAISKRLSKVEPSEALDAGGQKLLTQ